TDTSNTATFNPGANNGTAIVTALTAAAQTIAGSADIYSLRLGSNNMVISGGDLMIRSGGLISASTNATIAAHVDFGDGVTPVEAVLFSDIAQGANVTFSGSLTANGLTKLGRGAVTLTGSNDIT